METKTVPFELKASDEPGSFKGYGAIFGNRDLGGDIIEAGAFKKFKYLAKKQIAIAAYHDLERIVGKATVTQDEKGLYLDGVIDLDDIDGQKIHRKMKFGTLTAMSVGFNILKDGSEWTEDYSTRTIKKAELWEVSIVPFGMNPKAKVQSVKSVEDIQDIRGFERLLKDSGYSRKQATAIALHGFKAFQRDAGSPNGSLSDSDEQTSVMLGDLKSHMQILNQT